ncbi:hypothetical protein [Enterococcus wangshanyuanii]|uniref:TPM domain-containing protein n=1 Tax=Enterococcus wangshanyuanii TaxID=2005703 RepID=A0ABQ1NUV4_9ENTE|nr:hypothetical protein [Enterococcus wangshanyuanii]GGC85634.1 hypothetical protein GCM10011573_14100 [Enterococcus wangshanyuanii]
MFLLSKINQLFDERLFSILPIIIILISIVFGKLIGLIFNKTKTEEKKQSQLAYLTKSSVTPILVNDKNRQLLSELKSSLCDLTLSQEKIKQIQQIFAHDSDAATFVTFYHEKKEAFICTGLISNGKSITFTQAIDEHFLEQLQGGLLSDQKESLSSEFRAILSILDHHVQLTGTNKQIVSKKISDYLYQINEDPTAQVPEYSFTYTKEHSVNQYKY